MPHTGLYLSLSIAAILLLAPPAIAGKGTSISLNKVTKVGKLIVIKDSSKLGATLQESSAGTVEATIRCKKSGYRAAAIGAVKLPKKSTVVTRQAPAYFLPNWCKKDKVLTTLDVCQSGDKQFKIIVQACKDGIPHVKLPVTIKGMCAKVKTAVGPAKMGVWSVFPLTWTQFHGQKHQLDFLPRPPAQRQSIRLVMVLPKVVQVKSRLSYAEGSA